MASEYYRKKFQNLEPEKPYEMTKKEKWKNWWYYHWLTVLVVTLIVAFVCFFVAEFVFRERPDYKLAYVGANELVVDIEDLQTSLEALGQDLNNDGEVVVQIRSYLVDDNTSIYSSEMIPLVGDLESGHSTVFILEDPQWFADHYHVTSMDETYCWSDCPAISDIDLYGEYYIALRTTEDMSDDYRIDPSLWEAMIAGAQ